MLPDAVVEGVGAVADPVPPVAAAYQSKFVPIAVNAVAVAFPEKIGEFTIGAAGVAVTSTVITARGDSHPLTV